MSKRRREVVLVSFDGIQLLDVVGPAEVLDAATRLLGGDCGYRLAMAITAGLFATGGAIGLAAIRKVPAAHQVAEAHT